MPRFGTLANLASAFDLNRHSNFATFASFLFAAVPPPFPMDDAFKLSQIIPVDDLRLSNQVPSDRHRLRRILQEVREKEDALEALVHKAPTRRAEYASYAESILDVLAPGRIVPADVWSLVFGHIPDSRWTLSWVCRGWREIAFATPELWSDIPELGAPVKSSTNFLSRLQLHVKCSKARPLTITKLRLPLETKFCPDDMEEFFTIFHAMIPRIESICLSIGMLSATTWSFLIVAPQNYSKLQNVDIYTSANAVMAGNLSALPEVKIFQSSPKLSSLRCFLTHGAAMPPMTTFLRIPWTTVTFLSLAWLTRQDVYHVLENAPLLRSLSIFTDHRYLEDNQGHVAQKKIKHLRLRYLCWKSDAPLNLDLFSIFDLPNVQQITIHTYNRFWARAVQTSTTPNTPLICKPFSYLSRLFIGPQWQNNYTGQRLVALLRLTPALNSLWLSWVDGMEDMFGALSTPATERRWLLPDLCHLRIANVPKAVLMSTGRAGWHCALRTLGKERGFVGNTRPKNFGPRIRIVLSGAEKCKTVDMKKVRSGIICCLNELLEVRSVGEEGMPETTFEAIRKLVEQINAPSSGDEVVRFPLA